MNEREANLATLFPQQPMTFVQAAKEPPDALDETLLGIAIMMQVHFDVAKPGVSHTRQFVEHARLVLLLG
jgi:hypothetical protein